MSWVPVTNLAGQNATVLFNGKEYSGKVLFENSEEVIIENIWIDAILHRRASQIMLFPRKRIAILLAVELSDQVLK